jgi:hypothetical protein
MKLPLGARTAIAAAVLVLAAPNAVLAGGAEPLRIEFKRGAYGATISDSVRGDEEAQFVLAAKEGQRLTVKVTSVPDKSAVFKLLVEGDDTSELLQDAKLSYAGVLPKTGDYFIFVTRSAGAKGPSRFRLAVTVR